MINPKIFKSYDVRGVYPTDLNEEAAYAIGRAFARQVGVSEIVVGSDMRVSGPALKKELIRGITDEGVNVVDIGLVPIDGVYFSVGSLKYPAGIMITASHNPKEYNGFKMVGPNVIMVRGEAIRDIALQLPELPADAPKGTVKEVDIFEPFIKHILSFADTSKIKPFKVVVDAGNGMSGKVVPLLAPHLPITVIPLNFELDGNFPAHPSNPLLPESQVQICKAVVEHRADFGVIFDGDTDRLFFVDEQGKFIRADFTLLLLAREFLKREPGKGIAYNAVCSKIVPEKIAEWGGVPLRTKVGFVNVTTAMREHDGIMGGELSAHYSFRDNGYADSGFIAWLILMQLISTEDRPLSALIQEFNVYVKPDEINFEIEDRQKVIDGLKAQFTDGQIDELDGFTVTYPDWWFNVRSSNTEPLLRITIEANNQQIFDEKHALLLSHINSLKA